MSDNENLNDPDAAAKAATEAPQAADAAANAASAKTAADTASKDAAANPEANSVVPAGTLAPMLVTTPISTSYFDLLKAVVTDQGLTGEQKQVLLSQLKGSSPTSDRLTYRLATWILGFIALITIIAIWHLTSQPNPVKVPDGLIAIASGAVGGLAGLLSPSRSGDTQTQS